MSVLHFYEHHSCGNSELTYEQLAVDRAYQGLLRDRDDRDFISKKTTSLDEKRVLRTVGEQLRRDPKVDGACDRLHAAARRLSRVNPRCAARHYDELLANGEAGYRELVALASTDYGRRAIADTRRALARAAHSVANEGTKP